MARPKLDIDEAQVYKLAKLGATNVDIGYVLGCDEAQIRRRFAESVAKGRAERRNELRTWQWKAAEEGNISMLIWLGKQYLGQADKVETKDKTESRISPEDQLNMLGNPKAVELACDLDKAISAPKANGRAGTVPAGDDPGGVRPSRQRR